jgi:hypothetical protein
MKVGKNELFSYSVGEKKGKKSFKGVIISILNLPSFFISKPVERYFKRRKSRKK